MALERDWIAGVCASVSRVAGSTDRPLIFLVMVPGPLTVVNGLCAKVIRKAHADHHVRSEHRRVCGEGFFETKLGGFGLGFLAEDVVSRAQQLPLFRGGIPSLIDDTTKSAIDQAFAVHALEVFCGESGDEVAREDGVRIALGVFRREREDDPAVSARQAELARWIYEELLPTRKLRMRGPINSSRVKGPLASTHVLELSAFYRAA